MKHKLLFLVLILFSFQNTVQAQTPCGITELTACDDDIDGLAIFDITILDDNYPFCMINASSSDYYAPTHHISQEDADTGSNPITNPETYEGSNGQFIFMRAEPLNSGTHEVLAFQTYELRLYCYDASFTLTPTCDGATATITGDPGGIFSFNPEPGDGAAIGFAGTITGGTSGATYCVRYTISGADPVFSTECFTVLPSEDASFFMTPTCDGATATITGDIGGTFAFNPAPGGAVVIDSLTGTVAGAIAGETYYVEYTTSGPCVNSSIEPVTIGCGYGGIKVDAFIDENSNGILDDLELNFNQGVFTYEVNNDGIIHEVSSSSSHIISVDDESNTYDISFAMDERYNSCLNQTITLVENVTATEREIIQVNFPLTQIGDCNDIAVYLVSNSPPRPGVISRTRLIVDNLGTVPVSGSVEFTLDESVTLLDVLSVESGDSVTNTATGFILNFNDLQPGTTELVIVRYNVPTSAMLGDFITNSAVYNVSDLNIDNNESSLTEVVVNSYDPNDKMESHGPEIKFEDFTSDDYLFYTIRFQNLGTAEAIDIRIEDVLDGQLDTSTFKMLHASHDYVLTRTDNNLEWEFEDINLPSESMDEPNSHGYVYFKIKPLTGYGVDDIIPNFADIYFDFNPAVTTNTFETEFVASLSVDEFNASLFKMYPNPVKDLINIEFYQTITTDLEINFYDIHGKSVLSFNDEIERSKIQLDVSQLSQGMYFVEFKGDAFKTVKKLIIE